MSEIMSDLDRLLERLAEPRAGTASTAPAPDAIDVERARPARGTAVQSVREAPEVAAFRDELIDGLIRVDTANRLLRLIAMVLEARGW